MGARIQRARRAIQVTRVARSRRLLRVLRELGVVGVRPATREGAVEFRLALEQLGTTYLKLGQLLSSRPDLLPDVYIEELGRLVDEVPPFPFSEVERIVREDLGAEAFARLDPEPLAAASIAQIHRALLSQDRLDDAEAAFSAAEASFGQLGSASHRAAAWVARGDLAARRGDDRLAAHLYRTAAEALQDVRF